MCIGTCLSADVSFVFQPPQICRSQSSNFSIIVQKLGENGNTETVYMEGPVGYTNGSGAEKIIRDIRSRLEKNQEYLLTVHFSTVAGDSNSSYNFSKWCMIQCLY